jgi:hypothetical protein
MDVGIPHSLICTTHKTINNNTLVVVFLDTSWLDTLESIYWNFYTMEKNSKQDNNTAFYIRTTPTSTMCNAISTRHHHYNGSNKF